MSFRFIMFLGITLLVFATSSWAGQMEESFNAYQAGDYSKAQRIWLAEADRGNGMAQYNLGVMYEQGRGVKNDDKEAVRWYHLAAKQGIASAQLNLGFMYVEGRGVEQDLATAYAWWVLAAGNNNDTAPKNLEEAEAEMTPAQIEKGKQLAKELQQRISE